MNHFGAGTSIFMTKISVSKTERDGFESCRFCHMLGIKHGDSKEGRPEQDETRVGSCTVF